MIEHIQRKKMYQIFSQNPWFILQLNHEHFFQIVQKSWMVLKIALKLKWTLKRIIRTRSYSFISPERICRNNLHVSGIRWSDREIFDEIPLVWRLNFEMSILKQNRTIFEKYSNLKQNKFDRWTFLRNWLISNKKVKDVKNWPPGFFHC